MNDPKQFNRVLGYIVAGICAPVIVVLSLSIAWRLWKFIAWGEFR